MTGPAVPPGGEELREAIVKALAAPYSPTEWDVKKGYLDPEEVAAVVLPLPEMRDALAAQEKLRSYANDPAPTSEQLRDLVIRNRELEAKLRRVEALVRSAEDHPMQKVCLDIDGNEFPVMISGERLRRALNGEPT